MNSLHAVGASVRTSELGADAEWQESSRAGARRLSSSYHRRRAGNACNVCRARKTKCDNQRPVCGFCAATGGNCHYVEADASQFDRASLAILHRLGQLETAMREHIDGAFQQHRPWWTGQRPPWAVGHGDVEVEGEGNGSHMMHEMHARPDDVSDAMSAGPDGWRARSRSASADRPASAKVLRQASEMSIDAVVKWPIFRCTVPHLEELMHTPIVQVLAAQSSPRHVPGHLGTALHSLTPDAVQCLVDNFLANNHVKNPVLDIESLQIDAREFSESGLQWDGRSCLMLLVCAIGSITAPLHQELVAGPSKSRDRLAVAEAYFHASQRRIGMLYHDTSLLAAQCSFLTGVYLMSTMQILAAWKCFVQAATQCLAFTASHGPPSPTGEHARDPDAAKRTHLEESLYWSCLKSEMEVKVELSLPGSGLNEMRYPHTYPSPPMHMSPTATLGSPEPLWCSPPSNVSATDLHNLETGWFFYLAEIATKRMISNAMVWLFQSRSHLTDAALAKGVAEYETQMHAWYEALPATMKFPRDPHVASGDILRYILRGHMLDIREVIRFPAIQRILASDVPVTADFSALHLQLAREFLANAADRILANREGLFHRHQGTWLGLRSCGRSALQLLSMACRCRVDAASAGMSPRDLESRFLPSTWEDAVALASRSVAYWADESPDLQRMDQIMTEVRRAYEALATKD